MKPKLLIIQAAALGHELTRQAGMEQLGELPIRSAETIFPAVTCSVQAGFRTASPVSAHGMAANGRYFPELHKVLFWEQSADLVAGRRFWSDFRAEGGKVGMLFWQQSMGEELDMVVSPAPIHKHHGGMIQDCYTQPPGLYRRLVDAAGRTFKLQDYWGPKAGFQAGNWIAGATARILAADDAPDLLLTYLPTLDYDLQRYGPLDDRAQVALNILRLQIEGLIQMAGKTGHEVMIFGDYAIGGVSGPAVLPNLALAEAGLFAVRDVRGMLYPDFHTSRALAVVDHEVAIIHVPDPADVDRAASVLGELEGVQRVITVEEMAGMDLDHPHCGQLLCIAEPGRWLAYPWWSRKGQAPDYAGHIDIHNKPGFDPCELFFARLPIRISQDTSKISGSHGRIGPDRRVAWACSFQPVGEIENILDLARAAQKFLEDK
ncbi:MAG: alkaline phosphatase family protein [Phycisphaerae bacterium]